MKRYTATVKENGDQFRSFYMEKINEWITHYKYECETQDDPWTPHFEVSEEIIR